jgi:hypothetical protein
MMRLQSPNHLQSVIVVAEIFMRLGVHYGIDSRVNEPKLMALVSRFSHELVRKDVLTAAFWEFSIVIPRPVHLYLGHSIFLVNLRSLS